MPRSPDSGQLDFSEVFLRVQQEMIAQMAVGGLFEHASSAGDATEQHWIDLFTRYLPMRYRATPAFVVDSTGRRSRQIDIAIFDNLYSPLLFPHSSGLHIAAESVYAVFEVKPTISRQWIRDAGEKAASVRALRRTSVPVIAGGTPRSAIPPSPILAGLLATGSVWSAETFEENVRRALASASPSERLDLGCSLQHGAFECLVGQAVPPARSRARQLAASLKITVSSPDESLIFFVLRLLERMRAMGTPAADLMEYGRSLRSFKH
jgi:hypothetical protein